MELTRMKKGKLIPICIIIGLVIAPFALLEIEGVKASSGNILYVGRTGPSNYTGIQDAIDNSTHGDTVYVYAGYYYENVVVNKSINLVGEDKDTTIIDGVGSGDVIYVSSDWVNISGFTIRNSGNALWVDAGIDVFISNFTNLSGNIIKNNSNHGVRLYSSSKNTIKKNLIIDNNQDGISLNYGSSNNVILRNIIKTNGGWGINLRYVSNNNTILENNVSKNHYDGISIMYGPKYNNIMNNSINDHSPSGIYLDVESATNNNNIISGNYVFNNTIGIYVYHSRGNLIKDNTIYNNSETGIKIARSCYNNNIYQNVITDSSIGIKLGSGPWADPCEMNIISKNAVMNSTRYGIWSEQSNNSIYHNSFIDNTQNAYDVCNNHWDNGSEGNYWDDYEWRYPDATPVNRIWDTPYDIPGGWWNQDRYPLVNPADGEVNQPPNTPAKPSGSSLGYTGTSYSYSTLTADSDNDQVKYYFDWGDGTGTWTGLLDSGESVSKSHSWNDPGTYNVKVKAQDEHGVESDWSPIKTVTITTYTPPPSNQPPTCSLSANPTSGYTPLNITFSMSASDPDGTITSWQLDINNDRNAEYSDSGTPPSTQQHTYQNAGTYTAKLTVVDNDGATATDTTTVTVSKKPNQPPIANFLYTPESPVEVGITLHFRDNSTDVDGEIVNHTWDFGDGTTTYGNEVNHTFAKAGTYTVTVVVTDNDGDIDRHTVTITVEKEKKETPGFEGVILLVALVAILLSKGRRILLITGIAIAVIATASLSGCLESLGTTDIEDIERDPYKYDGKTVTVKGYAVPHGTSDYFEISDDGYSIGVDCTHYGDKTPELGWGTYLRVTGTVEVKEEYIFWETHTTATLIMKSWKYI